jgi:hypothetical protein
VAGESLAQLAAKAETQLPIEKRKYQKYQRRSGGIIAKGRKRGRKK